MSDIGFSSPIDLGLDLTPGNIEKFEEVREQFELVYRAIRNLQVRFGDYAGLTVLDPTNFLQLDSKVVDTIQVQRLQAIIVTSSEAIGANDFVNLHSSTGLKVRRAQANAASTRAWGWAPNAISNGAKGIVYLLSGLAVGAGLTEGTVYYLSTSSPGGIQSTVPSGAGNIIQEIGIALSSTELLVSIGNRYQPL